MQVRFGTPPKLRASEACSARLPLPLRARALGGIDNYSKAEYDELLPYWLRCPSNMASNRQTRALSFNHLGQNNNTGGLRSNVCRTLPGGRYTSRCDLQIARRALYQFSFLGLNEERCATERLFEAQFGLRFGAHLGAAATSAGRRAAHEHGKDAHKVARLRYEELSAVEQRRVRWLNRDDLLLYAEARRVFHERLKAYGIPPEAECRRQATSTSRGAAHAH